MWDLNRVQQNVKRSLPIASANRQVRSVGTGITARDAPPQRKRKERRHQRWTHRRPFASFCQTYDLRKKGMKTGLSQQREIRYCLHCFSETGLNPHITNEVTVLDGRGLFRADRTQDKRRRALSLYELFLVLRVLSGWTMFTRCRVSDAEMTTTSPACSIHQFFCCCRFRRCKF